MRLQTIIGRAARLQGRTLARSTSNATARLTSTTLRDRSFSALRTTSIAQRVHAPSQVAWTRAFSTGSSEDVPVPSMGDSISEGTVVEWLKNPGDQVAADDVVVVLETDKVSVDVRAPFSGVLDEHLAGIDDNVTVGSALFRVTPGEVSSTEETSSTSTSSTEAASTPEPSNQAEELETIPVPSMGDSISEGTIATVLKNVGDYVKADEAVVLIETDKVSVDVNAPYDGRVTSILANVDDAVEVGAPLFVLDKAATPPPTTEAPKAPEKEEKKETPTPKQAKQDKPTPAPSTPSPRQEETPSTGKFSRNETRVQMSAFKTRAAQRQKDTQNTAAMLSTFQECDLTNLISLRDELGDAFEKENGIPLGFMSVFLKASALALQQEPAVNSFMDLEAKEILRNDFIDINVAVASEKGVVSPVIRNVESLSITEIEQQLATFAQQARDGTLAVEDLAGGTFTVANAGIQGSLLSTGMLNSPQSAVLNMHSVKMRPNVGADGRIEPRPMMYLSLTYDHRIVDGREGVTFLKTIAETVSDPRRLLLA